MESFFRYISYIDYYKKDSKERNVGFLRWKLYRGVHKIEMQIRDVKSLKGKCEIKEVNTGIILGELYLDQGIGSFIKEFESKTASSKKYIEVEKHRLYLSDIEGFIIPLALDEYLKVSLTIEDKNAIEEKTEVDTEEFEKNAKENLLIENTINKDIETITSKVSEETTESNLLNKEIVCQEEKNTEENLIFGNSSSKLDRKIKIIEPIYDNKWDQLCNHYPKVHPFPDKKIFLSIKPKDFIILQQEYQKLIQNSFLLHGFYNYGHMILGKLTEEKDAPIYIGVPGVYYEREKQAAQMFGFVGFESAEHPVQAGSYGYYMIEVKI